MALRAPRVRPSVAAAVGVACSLFVVAALIVPATAHADSRFRVVIARPLDADSITVEALARVSGELTAAGFDIRTIPINRDADARSTVEAVGRELDPVAAFAIFPGTPSGTGQATAEIWVSDRLAGRATVQRLVVDPRSSDRGAGVLAVHAVELLKASLAELWVDKNAPEKKDDGKTEPPVRAVAPVREPEPESPPRDWVLGDVGISVAGGVLAHADGFSTGWTPAVRLSFGLPEGFAVRLGAAGVGQKLEITRATGTATVRQEMATVELIKAFLAGSRVQPIVLLVAGGYRLGVSGKAAMPETFFDQDKTSWSFVAGAGGGVAIGLGEHVALTADLQALGFFPRLVGGLGDAGGTNVEVGQTGLPAIFATVGIAGVL